MLSGSVRREAPSAMMSGGSGQRLGIKPGSNRAGMEGVSVRLVRVKFSQDLRRDARSDAPTLKFAA